VNEIKDLEVGDEVQLCYARAKNPFREGVVVGFYERFFNVHFGRYQESFLWVDLAIGQLRVLQAGKRSVSRAN